MPERNLTPRTAVILAMLLVLLVALSVYRLQCAGPVGPYVPFTGRTMGTTYDVKVADADLSPDDIRSIGAKIESTLERVNALMSTWRADSELSRFNATHSTEPFDVQPETARVFAVALEISRRSRGTFDVTVRPMVEAWGFGETGTPPAAPTEVELDEIRSHVGWQKLRVDEARSSLGKTDPLLEADLSAIAKGYGVDAVSLALEQMGYHAYLVEVGGELRANGVRLDGRAFRVAIEAPDLGTRSIHRVLELRDMGMATSGDYRNFVELDGDRLSHTLDPRTGRPISHRLASVTVLHQSAMWADAWATALNVMGPDTGYDFAVAEGLAAYFIVRSGSEGFETRATPVFADLVDFIEMGHERSPAASNQARP